MPRPLPKLSTPHRTAAKPVRIGFIPLADCAPLLVATKLDYFRRNGVKVELSCEVGWATIREKLLYRQVDAAHAIAGLALAMRLGLSSPPCAVVAPFVFNLHGNAITLSRDLWNRGVRDAASLRKLIRSSTSRRFTFGMVSRYSSHHFLLRRWLRSGEINPDQDVRIVALPPTQMAANLAAGLIDGYCVGEPWNSAAVHRGTGWIAATSEQLAPLHPEKVLLMLESFAMDQTAESQAIVHALKEACAFCDSAENRAEVVKTLSESGYFTGNEEVLRRSLVGPFDLGTSQFTDASSFHIFKRHDANRPTADRGRWLLQEFISHGLLSPDQRPQGMDTLEHCWREITPLSPTPAATAKINNAAKRTITATL